MLVEWLVAIIEDRVQRRQVVGVGIQLSVYGGRFDRNDATVMIGCNDLGRRFVRDDRERKQLAHAGFLALVMIPETGHQHVVRRVRSKLQHKVFFLLAGRELVAFSLVPCHVFIKRVHDHNVVPIPEQLGPRVPRQQKRETERKKTLRSCALVCRVANDAIWSRKP